MRRINPPKYELMLKGSAPANYTLNSTTLYRTLVKPEDISHVNQIEAFYKYDYGQYGIYREEVTRSILDSEYWMRWTVFVNKIEERKPGIIITTGLNDKKVIWFYPKKALVVDDRFITIEDTKGVVHKLFCNPILIKALRFRTDYIDVDEANYVPVYNFRMWYMVF